MRIAIIIFAVLLGSVSCDRSAKPTRALPSLSKSILNISTLAQLWPNRLVHTTVDVLGNIYYVEETPQQQDGVLIVGSGGLPRATQLTSANILAAMGEQVGGSGSIQSLAAAPGGSIWFWFVGGKGKQIHACLGQFNPRGEDISIRFNTAALEQISGMGESIELARGELIPSGSQMALLLRHTDGWAMLWFNADARTVASASKIYRGYRELRLDDQPLNPNDERYQFSPGAAEKNLLLTDRATGIVYDVDADGHAKFRVLLAGLPRQMSRPMLNNDELLIFAADSEKLESDDVSTKLPQVTYPALLRIGSEKIVAIGRDDMHASAGFAVYAMRIAELQRGPDDTLIGYDSSSGFLLRMTIASE